MRPQETSQVLLQLATFLDPQARVTDNQSTRRSPCQRSLPDTRSANISFHIAVNIEGAPMKLLSRSILALALLSTLGLVCQAAEKAAAKGLAKPATPTYL